MYTYVNKLNKNYVKKIHSFPTCTVYQILNVCYICIIVYYWCVDDKTDEICRAFTEFKECLFISHLYSSILSGGGGGGGSEIGARPADQYVDGPLDQYLDTPYVYYQKQNQQVC